MKLESGHELVSLDEEEMKRQNKDWGNYKEGLVRLTPGRWLFPTHFKQVADKFYTFKFRSSDVVIMTYPKCGSTWTTETVWTMRSNPEFNNPLAKKHFLARTPMFDMDMMQATPKLVSPLPSNPFTEAFLEMCPGQNPEEGINLQLAEAIPDPRTMKTHLPFSLLPPSLLDTAKVVYIVRNPKDVIISFHHHFKIADTFDYIGSFEDFVQYFVDDDLMYGPYWLHVKEALEKRNHPNLHFIFYEDMKANTIEELRKLNTFLNTNLTEKQLENIAKYTSFSEMKDRYEKAKQERSKDVVLNAKENKKKIIMQNFMEKEGGFFRKGEVGDWKRKLTPDLEAKVDQWIQKNMTSFGFNFKYGV